MANERLSLLICLVVLWSSLALAQEPRVKDDGISISKVLTVGFGFIRLVHNPATADLFVLKSDEGLFQLELGDRPSLKPVTDIRELGGEATGLAFDATGTAYIATNSIQNGTHNVATIHRGLPLESGGFSWEILARTEAYPRSNTIFNHNVNGLIVDPSGRWLFVNSGSRTDHGEVQDYEGLFPEAREVPLTSIILRLPTDSQDLILPNNETALREAGYIFAEGVRNAYDLAFAPNGHLFAIDNGPDADYPEELNWIREGHHYGFPWKFGDWDNQQQFADYDAEADRLQQPDFTAVREGYYQNDPDFPAPPTSFTQPVMNLGPDAMIYRALDGSEVNAAEVGALLYTFTPHRSPLGLVFVDGEDLPARWQSQEDSYSAFILSWGAAGGSLSDRGMDILHLQLSRTEDNYQSITTQIADQFKNPIDAALVDNKLYVLEWGDQGAIWELRFKE